MARKRLRRVATDELDLVLRGLHLAEGSARVAAGTVLQRVRELVHEHGLRQEHCIQLDAAGRRREARAGAPVCVPRADPCRRHAEQDVRAVEAARCALVVRAASAAAAPTDGDGCQLLALRHGELVALHHELERCSMDLTTQALRQARACRGALHRCA
jgi:hypothetical protein